MRKKSLVPVVAISILASGIAWSGGAWASAKAPTTGTSGGRGTSKAGGVVQITAYSDNDGPTDTAVVTGAIADFGRAVRTYANGTVVQEYNRLELEVTHGTFQLAIAGLETSLVSAFAQFPTDLSTCSGIVIVHGTTPVVAGSGTGAYRGIRGSFKMTVTINEVDQWPKCPRTGQGLLTESVFLTASGTVSFA